MAASLMAIVPAWVWLLKRVQSTMLSLPLPARNWLRLEVLGASMTMLPPDAVRSSTLAVPVPV